MFAFPKGVARSVGTIWHDAWVLFTQEFKQIAVLSLFVSIIANTLTYYSFYTGRPPVHFIGNHASFIPGIFFHAPAENGLLLSLVWVVVMAVVNMVPASAILLYLYRRGRGEQLTPRDAMQVTWERVPRLLVATLVVAISVIIGFMLFIVPGVILGILWLMVPLVILVENTSIKGALSRSANVVWGSWWYAAIAYGVMAFILAGLSFLLEFVPRGFPLLSCILITLWATLVIGYLSALLANLFQEVKVRQGEHAELVP